MRFRCRHALFDIVDQAQFSSSSSVDGAKLDTLRGKAKSLGQELSDNSKAPNKHASSQVHDSDYCNNLVLANETMPYVCRSLSRRIAHLQHRQKTT